MGKYSRCCYNCNRRTITCKINCPEWLEHEREKQIEYNRRLNTANLTQCFQDSANRKDRRFRNHFNLPK